jgi:hypothetical protein
VPETDPRLGYAQKKISLLNFQNFLPIYKKSIICSSNQSLVKTFIQPTEALFVGTDRSGSASLPKRTGRNKLFRAMAALNF